MNDEFENEILWKDDFHFQFFDKKGFIVNDDFEILKSESKITVDYCLLVKYVDIAELSESYEISLLILDASLPV